MPDALHVSDSAIDVTRFLRREAPMAANDVLNHLRRAGVDTPPSDYLSFLAVSNGAEGRLGAEGYLALWPAERIRELNELYEVARYADDLVLIGSDGGDEALAIDLRSQPPRFVEIPFLGLDRAYAQDLGTSFIQALETFSVVA